MSCHMHTRESQKYPSWNMVRNMAPHVTLRVRCDWSSQLSLAIDAAEYRIKHELLSPGGLPLGPAGASS